MNRSSAQQGNPNRNRVGREETDAREPTDPQPGLTTIPDRVFVEAHLRTVRPECDQPESPFDDAEVRIGRGLKHPKDKGYGKFLETLGYDRNWAGMQAAMIVEEGRVRAATSKRSWEFAQALRRLANPGLETKAFLAAAKVAREAMDGTELTRGSLRGTSEVRGAFCSFGRSSSAWRGICLTELRCPGFRKRFGAALQFRASETHSCVCRA